MKMTPEELAENKYVLLDKMEHNDIMPFLKKYLNKKTFMSALYYLSVIIFLLVLIIFTVKNRTAPGFEIKKVFRYFSNGLLLTLILIPFHELIHALAYKLSGAKNTSFDMNLKKFYFLAIADKFVANKKEFQFVALAPFTVITFSLLIILFFSGFYQSVAILTTLFAHSFCCSGDFALLSYFEFHSNKEVVTYDDKEQKVSYFFEKSR